jgi:hypothetical protein
MNSVSKTSLEVNKSFLNISPAISIPAVGLAIWVDITIIDWGERPTGCKAGEICSLSLMIYLQTRHLLVPRS